MEYLLTVEASKIWVTHFNESMRPEVKPLGNAKFDPILDAMQEFGLTLTCHSEGFFPHFTPLWNGARTCTSNITRKRLSGKSGTGMNHVTAAAVGCPVGAKNTLVKNYLWFAERDGAEVMPERTVVAIEAGAWLESTCDVGHPSPAPGCAGGTAPGGGVVAEPSKSQPCSRSREARASE